MYRVTPIFKGYDLVAKGVLMEGLSVEDDGEGIRFNVYDYNAQPGEVIDYFDGDSWLDGETPPPDDNDADIGGENNGEGGEGGEITYVLNTKTKKIHKPTCSGVASMKPENREDTTKTLDELIAENYDPCGTCKPE
jgi:DNA-entry nuclease